MDEETGGKAMTHEFCIRDIPQPSGVRITRFLIRLSLVGVALGLAVFWIRSKF